MRKRHEGKVDIEMERRTYTSGVHRKESRALVDVSNFIAQEDAFHQINIELWREINTADKTEHTCIQQPVPVRGCSVELSRLTDTPSPLQFRGIMPALDCLLSLIS